MNAFCFSYLKKRKEKKSKQTTHKQKQIQKNEFKRQT